MFVSSGTVFINSPQVDNMKKQLHTRYNPKVMTWVIRPLSTCLPENIRDTAMPTAIKVKNNPEFRKLHHYYTTREKNPLKKKQSLIAICCKLLRVFFVIATKGCAYDREKLLADIRKNQPQKAA